MAGLVWPTFGTAAMLVVVGGLLTLVALIALWWWRYDESQVRANYLRMMRLGSVMTVGFVGFIGWQLAARV